MSTWLQATRTEFELRFWVIGLIFFLGFSTYPIDRVNACAWLANQLARLTPQISPDFWARGVFALAGLLLVLSAALRTWATAYLRLEVVHDRSQHSEAIVADGPYRHMRNSLYLAAILMAVGTGLLASRVGWCVIVLGMIVFVYRLVFREEAGLLASQGEAFRRYCVAVPRMIPSPRARLPKGGIQPRWGMALVAELFFWIMAAGMFVMAATLDLRLTGIMFGVSMVVYFVCIGVGRRIAKRSA